MTASASPALHEPWQLPSGRGSARRSAGLLLSVLLVWTEGTTAFAEDESVQRHTLPAKDSSQSMVRDSNAELLPPGTDADASEAVVAVGNERRFYCSGTVIAERVVLTARHCLPATRIATGADSSTPQTVIPVVQSHAHPDPEVDVALLLLKRPPHALPRLPLRDAADTEPPAGEALLVGYGAKPPRRYGVRRSLSVPISSWGCDLLRARVTGCHVGRELVLPRLRGTDTCDGDSGGPVLERVEAGYRILAVTSRPIAAYRLRCGDGGVYVRADIIADWLKYTLRNLNQVPTIP